MGFCPFLFWYGQNFCIQTVVFPVASSKIAAPVTLVQISDLHGLRFDRNDRQLIGQIAAAQPDLICATGDMYTRGDASGRRIAVTLLRELCALCPVLFVPGEHDREPGYLRELSEAGILLPTAPGIVLEIGDTQLCIQGCSAAWFPPGCDWSERYRIDDSKAFRILLCHIPRPDVFATAGVDLMLSGDSHGGLMRLNRMGSLYANGLLFPEWKSSAPQWISGAYDQGGWTLWVNPGLGGVPARLFNRPEISVIQLCPDGK